MEVSDSRELSSYERIIESGKAHDYLPTVQAAGKSIIEVADTSAMDVQPDIYFAVPPTPRQLQKYRRNYTPGVINVHYGLRGQPLPPKEFRYGMETNKGENVGTTLAAGKKEGIAEYMEWRGEQIYATTKREPLGVSYNRGHEMTDEVKAPGFEFGYKIEAGEPAKETIWPRGAENESEEIRKRYVLTHGDYAPGEMVERNYNWPVDRDTFTFGMREKFAEKDGAKAALTMDRNHDKTYPKTRIVKRSAEDYRTVVNDHLGQGKNMMQGTPPVPHDFAFGIKSNAGDVTAGDCIRGWESEKAQQPDKDLGKCLTVGRRNQTTESRAFGCPSIRSDIPRPGIRSVADIQNYGDEVGASALLTPQRFELMGVPDEAFLVRRDREELAAILKCAGYNFGDEIFNDLYDKAVTLFKDEKQIVSLDAFLFVYSDMIKDEVADQCDTLGQGTRP